MYSSALQSGENMSIGIATAVIAAVLAAGGTFTIGYAVLVGLALAAIAIASTTRARDDLAHE